jgi:phosphoglycerol transferase MdoB-like AlkP superfamily enzyme
MEPADAEKLIHDSYRVQSDSSLKILTTDRPNVVIIQLESYTASIIESLGGDKGVAPNFEKFIQQGVLFNNIYSSADRTDKGIISIMSGFPSQAIRTIIADTLKQRKLPALSVVFKNAGYHTSYFYGGKRGMLNNT